MSQNWRKSKGVSPWKISILSQNWRKSKGVSLRKIQFWVKIQVKSTENSSDWTPNQSDQSSLQSLSSMRFHDKDYCELNFFTNRFKPVKNILYVHKMKYKQQWKYEACSTLNYTIINKYNIYICKQFWHSKGTPR